jgi:hypothetical protein
MVGYKAVSEEAIQVVLEMASKDRMPVTVLFCGKCFNGCQKIELRDGYLVFWHPGTDIACRIPTELARSVSVNSGLVVITIDCDNRDLLR